MKTPTFMKPNELLNTLIAGMLDAYDPCKPWAEQTDRERWLFSVFIQLVQARASVADLIAGGPAAGAGYPAIIFMLRKHRRKFRHLLVEWQVDREHFIDETYRMTIAFEENLKALSIEQGVAEGRTMPIGKIPRDVLGTFMDKLMQAGERMGVEEIDRRESGELSP